ncbi:MAG: DnaJ domain-containing protein [Phyllobacteriaceae bacterium]|nr:DnaJ domain-containing protein [Phyllobacteriaceae bacterium]
MNMMFLGIAALVGLLVAAREFVSADPASLARGLKRAAAAALTTFAVVMLMTGRIVVAIPLFVFALTLAGDEAAGLARRVRPFLGGWVGLFGGNRRAGRARSTVRSAALEMDLDADRGVLSGRVLVGRFEGRELAHLAVADLLALRREIAGDPESRSLLEAYLDRRVPLWRQHAEEDPAAGSRGAARPGAMTSDEAHQILGLRPGATQAEIREAHRRLIKAVHPDRGGSTFLAAKINEAKDRLIGNHRGPSDH